MADERQREPLKVRAAGRMLGWEAHANRAAEDDERYCELRIREEEALADAAGSPEAGQVHRQVAMLYKAQLATLRRCAGTREDIG
jgi:hypothetical protein